MRRWGTILLLALAACGGEDDDPGQVCAELAKSYLLAPATFELVTSSVSQASRDYVSALLSFDADNAYGTPIRGVALCDFQILKVDDRGHVDPTAEDAIVVYRFIRVQVNGQLLDSQTLQLESLLLCQRQTKEHPRAGSVC